MDKTIKDGSYFHPDSRILIKSYSENIVLLFKILMIDRIKESTDRNLKEIINLINILPLLLEFQFTPDKKPNLQQALDEIKLFDNLMTGSVKQLLLEEAQQP